MAEYENRERQYNDNLGAVIGRFCTAIVEADGHAKDSAAKRALAVIEKDNIDVESEVSIIGIEGTLKSGMNVNPVTITKVGPIEIEKATLSLDMSVAASQESTERLDSKTSVEASGKAGWGPFSLGVKIAADVSVGKESKRSSDYRSHTHAEVVMTQAEPPEGLMMLVNAMNETVATGLQINKALMLAKAAQIAGESQVALPKEEAAEAEE